MTDRLELRLAARIAEVARALDAVEAFGETQALPAKALFRLRLVLDELITNIVTHGAAGRDGGDIEMSLSLASGVIDVVLIDQGKPFDPVAAPLPELAASLEDSDIGGHGIRFVRSFVDQLDYRRDGGFNRLHFTIDPHRAERPPTGDGPKHDRDDA